jgi:hypothetical protein
MQPPHAPADARFPDIGLAFDPAQLDPSLFPPPPPLPASADLFTASEATDFFGFLDTLSFELDPEQGWPAEETPSNTPRQAAPYSNPHLNTAPEPSASAKKPCPRSSSSRGVGGSPGGTLSSSQVSKSPVVPLHSPPLVSDRTEQALSFQSNSGAVSSVARQKPLLSSPQKRLNHIMSEQKRRNAIRDGYAQLISLLTPVGAEGEIAMPARGRPKGSGSRSKGRGQGKSGVLFRAVEYCKWLEEGRDALKAEVLRVEAAAGIRHDH